jgi:hypothetical protein
MASALLIENSELKKRIADLEEKNMELAHLVKDSINDKNQMNPSDLKDLMNIKHVGIILLILVKLAALTEGGILLIKRKGFIGHCDENVKVIGKKLKNLILIYLLFCLYFFFINF